MFYDDDDFECEWDEEPWDDEMYAGNGHYFANAGSALVAESDDNPRNLRCPTCGAEDVLTPADRARGYQCDGCANRAEGYGW